MLNHTINDLEVTSSSKLASDTWDDEIHVGTVASALTGIASWESDGGPPPGCSNTIVWEFAANPRQPPPSPGGVHHHHHVPLDRPVQQ